MAVVSSSEPAAVEYSSSFALDSDADPFFDFFFLE